MLKTIRILFLGLVVCAGSACVTPTHASSAPGVVLAMVQAAGPSGAKEERVMLHNNAPTPINVTNWCVVNKAGRAFACLAPSDGVRVAFYLGAYQSIILYSQEAAARLAGVTLPQFVYAVTNQSSGSIVNGGDTLTLINVNQEVIDSASWSTAVPAGKVLSRLQSEMPPYEYSTSNTDSDWHTITPPLVNEASNTLEVRTEESTPGDDDNEEDIPSTTEGGELPLLAPIITELLPNPTGNDTGTEFIELFNPNNHSVSLTHYRLRVMGSSEKWFMFPEGASIPGGAYRAFYNSEIKFTLANTSGEVQLHDESRQPVGEVISYSEAKDGESWAYVDGIWRASKNPTPGLQNILKDTGEQVMVAAESLPKPCADNQFRNPETGRCKLIATATTPAPCKEGQLRNPDSGRCRNQTAAEATPAPCKPDQERNPETNRCRAVKRMSDVSGAVKGVQTTASAQLQWYYWAGIALLVLLVLGYGVWEWREELKVPMLMKRIQSFARRVKIIFAKRLG